MGILSPSKAQDKDILSSTRRKSLQPDFANLAPLKPGGTSGFVKFRDGDERSATSKNKSKQGSESDMDSDEDEPFSIIGKAEDEEAKEANSLLSPEEVRQQGELAEGVRQIKVSHKKNGSQTGDVSSNLWM